MAMFSGYVRRIDFEPKMEYLDFRIYAHIFLRSQDSQTQVDVYTDNPRFEAAFLAAFSSNIQRYVEVHYEKVGQERKVVRVVMDETFA